MIMLNQKEGMIKRRILTIRGSLQQGEVVESTYINIVIMSKAYMIKNILKQHIAKIVDLRKKFRYNKYHEIIYY